MATEGILSNQVYGGLQFFNAISGIAVSVLGISTNLMSIRTFLSMGLNDGVTVSFLSLSISDLVSSIFNWANCVALSLHAYEHFSGNVVCYIDPLFFNIIFGNLCFMTYTITILNTLYIGVTRCMCVVMPLQFRQIFTAKQSFIVAIVCALVPIAITCPIFTRIYLEPHQSHSSRLDCPRYNLTFPEDREEVKDVVYLIILTIIPFSSQIIVLVCMVVMVDILKKSKRIRRSMRKTLGKAQIFSENIDESVTGVSVSENSSTFHKNSQIVRFPKSLPDLHDNLNSLQSFQNVVTVSTEDIYNENTNSDTGKLSRTHSGLQSLRSSKETNMDTVGEWVADESPERQIHHETTPNTSPITETKDTSATAPLSHKESRVVQQVVLICAIFFLCNLPMIGMGIASMTVPGLDASFEKHAYVRMYYFLHYLRRVIEQFHSSINFFIYMKYNSKFRHFTNRFIKNMALVKLISGHGQDVE